MHIVIGRDKSLACAYIMSMKVHRGEGGSGSAFQCARPVVPKVKTTSAFPERYSGNATHLILTSAGTLLSAVLPAGRTMNFSSNGIAILAYVTNRIKRTTYIIAQRRTSTCQLPKLLSITPGVFLTRRNGR